MIQSARCSGPTHTLHVKGDRKVDELINLVSEKTGISKEMAKTAVDTVVGFLKEKLPAPIAGQIDNVLESPGLAGGASNLASGLGGLLGKKG